jgi:tRNA pseudouridine synthase 9
VTVGSVPKRLPRETGEDIGMGSPVPLSQEAVQVITNLRNMKVSFECKFRMRDDVTNLRMEMRIGVDGEMSSSEQRVN